MTSALIVVDMIRDFMEHGPLPVPGVQHIIPNINNLIDVADRSGWVIVYANDAHPANSSHFNKWPVHAVAGTKGAGLDARVISPFNQHFHLVQKGTKAYEDGYSAFSGVLFMSPKGIDNLVQLFRIRGVKRVFVCGVATEHCVLATVLDSVKYSFATYLVNGTHAGVDEKATEEALRLMECRGIRTNVELSNLM